jgi:hypothetical protein
MMRAAQQALKLPLLAAALAISDGCGGGSGGSGPVPPPVVSVSGKLDTTYGAGGRVFVESSDFVADRAGDIFVGGLAITKFDATGSPATGFVDGAPATSPQGNVSVDAAGNVYSIVTDFTGPTGHFILVKRDASGRPIESFGQAGRVSFNPGTLQLLGVRGAFPDGAGNVYLETVWHPPTSAGPVFDFLTKLDMSGQPISSFAAGTPGTHVLPGTLSLPSVLQLQGTRVTIDPAGNIFAVVPANTGVVIVEKFDANGQLVPGFSTTPTPVPCTQQVSFPWSIARDSAGNIYVGGTCSWGTEARESVFVVKLDAAGNPVPGFGDAGVAADFYTAGGSTRLFALQPSVDGAVYVSALPTGSSCVGMAIVKLGADGKPVDAFGVHGIVMPDLFAGNTAVDSLGRLYAGGAVKASCPVPTGTSVTYAVDRYNG